MTTHVIENKKHKAPLLEELIRISNEREVVPEHQSIDETLELLTYHGHYVAKSNIKTTYEQLMKIASNVTSVPKKNKNGKVYRKANVDSSKAKITNVLLAAKHSLWD